MLRIMILRICDIFLCCNIYSILCFFIPCIMYQIISTRRRNLKEKNIIIIHVIISYIFLVYIYLVLVATGIGTIWDIGQHGEIIRLNEINLIPFETNDTMPYILNIILFMPLGFLLPSIWINFRNIIKILYTGFIFSLAIEISQLFNNRATDIDDLIMNTLGSVIGYFLWICIFKCFKYMRKNKNTSFKDKKIVNIFKYEAYISIFLPFLGIFLLYNAYISS